MNNSMHIGTANTSFKAGHYRYLKPGEKKIFTELGALGIGTAMLGNEHFRKAYKGACDIKVEHTEDEVDIFDPEYYEAYYGIDLNLAKSRAFRDKELFNPNRDDEKSYFYQMYDDDDIPLAHNLTIRDEIFNPNEYGIIDTDFGGTTLPAAVTSPWEESKENVFGKMNKKLAEKVNYKSQYLKLRHCGMSLDTTTDVLFLCKVEKDGDLCLSNYLVKLCLGLYINEGYKWNGTTERIIREVNKTGQETDVHKKGNIVANGLNNFLSNEQIMEQVLSKSDT